MPDRIDDAARELYALAPEHFTARRADLVDRARSSGDASGAQAIGRLRKPTVGAWIVNALVLADPSVADRLTRLGERLRSAQERLDATALRELTGERRRLVDGLASDAFRLAGRREPPAALRDEVTATFEAAIADPDVAGRLGRLLRAEQWSGFGVLPTGAPELTVVPGGRPEEAVAAPEKAPAPRKAPAPEKAAARRRRERELSEARAAAAVAGTEYEDAQAAEHKADQRVRHLARRLAALQAELDDARTHLDEARTQVRDARARSRRARTALDRAERQR